MNRLHRGLKAALVAFALACGLTQGALAADDAAPRREPPKDRILARDAVCTRCHDETETYPIFNIARSAHGTRADARAPTCVNCHGESPNHIHRPPGLKDRPKTERTFIKGSPTPIAERSGACLACHKGGKVMHWGGSAHEAADLACTSCHQIHTPNDRVLSKATQFEVCLGCHKERRAQLDKNSRHPIKEGKVACSDCHNSHGSAGPTLMVRDSVVETCYACHAEKRGPFVRNHRPVTENCAICHNPHGSSNDNLLKSRPPFLCQQCHEPTSHRGAIPSLTPATGLSGANITQGRACLNCHTNIHGTNNPVNAGNQRTFRR